jgi:uncharacterized protein YqjF (DUF2071 family)
VERFDDAACQARSVQQIAHRPYPLPETRWAMGQTWRNLLFAHWRVPHDVLRPHVPDRLELEEHDGSAWIGLTPFSVTGLRVRGVPPLPFFSSFLELNCRTYVRAGDRPGIWFFSLDASSRAAVAAAQSVYQLPYRHARMKAANDRFRAETEGDGSFVAHYHGEGVPAPAAPATLEHFLVERYCLYAGRGDMRADIHHAPWPLQAAEARVETHGIAPVALEGKPICHYARRQDVLVWSPERLT